MRETKEADELKSEDDDEDENIRQKPNKRKGVDDEDYGDVKLDRDEF